MTTMPYRIDRTLVIHALPDTVFSFFTSSERWASWWGAGSTIDPAPGGAILIRYPNGVEAIGTVVDVVPDARLVFTFGFRSGQPIAPDHSRVTITLAPHASGTLLSLEHAFNDEAVSREFVQGWRYQLSVFANLVADLVHGDAASAVDAWFRLWAEPDAAARAAALAGIAAPAIAFRDRYSAVTGADELLPQIAATQRFMPGVRLERVGDVRHCQATLLADWVMRTTAGEERGRGTNVFRFGADGRIHDVVGLRA